jgi:hypothetical protein
VSDGWLGFFGGILAALVGGLIASIVQRHNEAGKRKAESQLDVYFQPLELSQWYFWVATAELHGEEPSEEALAHCRRISWKLADKIRRFDGIEHLDEILTILFSASIPSANERAERLDQLISVYGSLVNPRYARVIREISKENLLAHGPGKTPPNNAPGSWRYSK